MANIPPLREVFDPPEEIVDAALAGELVLFVGAGASRQLGFPSWKELAELALKSLRKGGAINYSELGQLRTIDDPKKQLSVAVLLAEDAGIELELEKHFQEPEADPGIYTALNEIACPCVTTNYDELLAPQFEENVGNSTGSNDANRIFNVEDLSSIHLDRPGTVVHLHGSVSNPKGMIVTTRDYLEHYDEPKVELFSRRSVRQENYSFRWLRARRIGDSRTRTQAGSGRGDRQ